MIPHPFFAKPWRLLAACVALLPLAAAAQLAPNWTSAQAGLSAPALAVDGSNTAWVVGSVADGTVRLAKVSPAGVTLLQRSLAVTGATVRSGGVSVDATGNAIVAARRVDAVGMPLGAVVAKFDSAGNLLWQNAASTVAGAAHRALSDAAGNVFVLGSQLKTSATGAITQDITLTKLDPLGTIQWVRSWGANATGPDGMVLTPAGQVLVAGWASATNDSKLAAFDAAGNTVWTASLASDGTPAVAVSAGGDIAVVGGAGANFLVARYNASFGPVWTRTYATSGAALRAAFDGQGNLLVNGATDVGTGFQIIYAWLTLKLDAAGNLLWRHTYATGVAGGDTPNALAVGGDGAVYVTGAGHTPLATGGTVPSIVALKLSAAGTQAWLASYGANAAGVALKVTSDGGVLVLADNVFTLSGLPPLAQLIRFPQSGQPNAAPVAVASASPSAGPAPLAVQFSAVGSVDPDGQIAGYAWDFGDGQGAATANPTHVYAAGTYTARLTVTDTLGAASAPAAVVVSSNAVAPARPTALTPASNPVRGGTAVTVRVTVSSATGVLLTLSSSQSAVASVPATLQVPAGATSATFTVRTAYVRRDTVVTLQATGNGATASALLTVRR